MEFGSRRDPKMEPTKKAQGSKGESLEGGSGAPAAGRKEVDLPPPGSDGGRHERVSAWVKENVTTNPATGLFTIKCGEGFTCHGFDVVAGLTQKYAEWLSVPVPTEEKGTLEAYVAYRDVADQVLEKCRAEKIKCLVELTPQLIGLEHKRVEVVDRDGEKRRFWVGRSTGDIPIHIEINNTRSMGGPAVMGAPFRSVTVVRESR